MPVAPTAVLNRVPRSGAGAAAASGRRLLRRAVRGVAAASRRRAPSSSSAGAAAAAASAAAPPQAASPSGLPRHPATPGSFVVVFSHAHRRTYDSSTAVAAWASRRWSCPLFHPLASQRAPPPRPTATAWCRHPLAHSRAPFHCHHLARVLQRAGKKTNNQRPLWETAAVRPSRRHVTRRSPRHPVTPRPDPPRPSPPRSAASRRRRCGVPCEPAARRPTVTAAALVLAHPKRGRNHATAGCTGAVPPFPTAPLHCQRLCTSERSDCSARQ